MVDWPDADDHFSLGVGGLTRIGTGDPRHLRLTDKRLFDYPWIYATQIGWWGLTDAETACLREYLLHAAVSSWPTISGASGLGSFQADDGAGAAEPPITEIADADAVMHVLYDIEEKDHTINPGTRHQRRGPGGTVVVEHPYGTEPAWRATYDDGNRMVVAVNFYTRDDVTIERPTLLETDEDPDHALACLLYFVDSIVV